MCCVFWASIGLSEVHVDFLTGMKKKTIGSIFFDFKCKSCRRWLCMYPVRNYCQLGFSWLHLAHVRLLWLLLPTFLECAFYWEHIIVLTSAAFTHVFVYQIINYLINSEVFILKNEIFLKIQHFLSLKKNCEFFILGGENYNIFENYIINVEAAKVYRRVSC
jgi:hypothetical protein